MKRFIVLLALAGLLAACHHGTENRGAPSTETGTVQGTGSSDNSTNNSDNIIVPQYPNY